MATGTPPQPQPATQQDLLALQTTQTQMANVLNQLQQQITALNATSVRVEQGFTTLDQTVSQQLANFQQQVNQVQARAQAVVQPQQGAQQMTHTTGGHAQGGNWFSNNWGKIAGGCAGCLGTIFLIIVAVVVGTWGWNYVSTHAFVPAKAADTAAATIAAAAAEVPPPPKPEVVPPAESQTLPPTTEPVVDNTLDHTLSKGEVWTIPSSGWNCGGDIQVLINGKWVAQFDDLPDTGLVTSFNSSRQIRAPWGAYCATESVMDHATIMLLTDCGLQNGCRVVVPKDIE